MPDVTPDWKRETEGGIGRKKPAKGKRSRGRIIATKEEWAAIRANKGYCRMVNEHCFGKIELHHLVPRSRGGDDVPANIVGLCTWHHAAVSGNVKPALEALAEQLHDAEYAYIVGKLGEGGIGRLFGG